MKESITELGAAIKRARYVQFLDMREVAEKCGFTYGYMSQIESGRIERRNIKVLLKIEKALSLEVGTLVCLSEKSRFDDIPPEHRIIVAEKILTELRKAENKKG